uniref:PH domain-containing protein n=1 Tax=Apteryx owenii TaxID=8824 RepID=A0A8B9PK25_APTOW
MQKSVRCNEGHALYLALLARKEGTKRGYLSKKTAETSRWHEKWFALYQNVLFYFESEQSARPAGMYMLEGCNCERVPAPKAAAAGSAKDAALDKQVPHDRSGGGQASCFPCPHKLVERPFPSSTFLLVLHIQWGVWTVTFHELTKSCC